MKRFAPAAVLAVLVVAAVVVWLVSRRGGDESKRPPAGEAAAHDRGQAGGAASSGRATADLSRTPLRDGVRKLAAKRDRELLLRAIRSARRARHDRGDGGAVATPPEGGPDTAAGTPSAPTRVPGTLDKDYIRSVIQGAVPMLADCYNLARDTAPGAAGQVTVEFTIIAAEDVGGMVETATIISDDALSKHPIMSECLTQTLLSLEYPAPENGGMVLVRYPFKFSNQPPADAPAAPKRHR